MTQPMLRRTAHTLAVESYQSFTSQHGMLRALGQGCGSSAAGSIQETEAPEHEQSRSSCCRTCQQGLTASTSLCCLCGLTRGSCMQTAHSPGPHCCSCMQFDQNDMSFPAKMHQQLTRISFRPCRYAAVLTVSRSTAIAEADNPYNSVLWCSGLDCMCVAASTALSEACLSLAGGSNTTQLSPHWRNILDVFQALLATLRQNYVPPFLVTSLTYLL